ncbi:MAG: hypothetical protein L3J39_14865 [Verrucomicrobiales bacterium]|nr:hypothetical protein [Verrucomicrobiales bacterium]
MRGSIQSLTIALNRGKVAHLLVGLGSRDKAAVARRYGRFSPYARVCAIHY